MWLIICILWAITMFVAVMIGIVWRGEVREAEYRLEDAENSIEYWKSHAERYRLERDRARHEASHFERSLELALSADTSADVEQSGGES